jgi:hemoglobin/transferrin/lactoferrin receptor protein
MMKNITLLFVSFIISLHTIAQRITLLDSENNIPIEFARILSKKPDISAITNINGQADISEMFESDSIVIRAMGYTELITSYDNLVQQNFIVLLNPLSLIIKPTYINAPRTDVVNRDVPARVSVFTSEDVSIINPQTTADLLGATGEVYIQKSQQGGGSPMIRGFSTNRLMIVVDGVRMNNAIFRGGNIQNIISIDPYNIDAAGVIFGPGAVAFGSDALGGVMNFQTISPDFSINGNTKISGSVATRFSSANNEFANHFDISIGWDKWAMLTSVSYNQFGDLRMGSQGPDDFLRPFYVQRINDSDVKITNKDPEKQINSGFNQIGILQKIRYKPNERWEVLYTLIYNQTSNFSRYDRLLETTSNGNPRFAEWLYGPQLWTMNALTLTNNARKKWYDRAVMRISHQKFEESRINRRFNNNNRSIGEEGVQVLSANIDFYKNLNPKHRIDYGAELLFNLVNSAASRINILTLDQTATTPRYPNSSWTSAAIFFMHQWKMNEKIHIHTGVRMSQIYADARFDTTLINLPFTSAQINTRALNGSLGVLYKANKSLVFQSNFSTGFRAPNIDDIGKVFDSEPGKVVVPNDELRSEYAYNLDFGLTHTIKKKFSWNLNVFGTYLNNALVRRDFTLNGLDSIIYEGELSRVQAIQNAAFAYVYGLQIGVDYEVYPTLFFKARFNYQYGEEEMDNGERSRLRHAAPMFGLASLVYQENNFRFEFFVIHNGSILADDLPISEQAKPAIYAKDENGLPYAPAWTTVNMRLSYNVSDAFRIQCSIENMTNERYRPYSSGLTAAGRNFIISGQWRF